MTSIAKLRRAVREGAYSDAARAEHVLGGFERAFGASERCALFSAPGRTELCGNHTDHQRGRVLAAAVELDFLACAAPNGTDTIRFLSEGWPAVEINLDRLSPLPGERESTAALVRGMAAGAAGLGCAVGGFDAWASSAVLPGSGLSSSAACEVLLGEIINRLFCGGGLDAVTIARLAQEAENRYFGKPSGLMDQMACALGGAALIDFADPAAPGVKPLRLAPEEHGYALCIIDSGASHAELTGEYAAIPREMGAAAAFFGRQALREVDEGEFMSSLAALRRSVGDRAALRAMHFFAENRRVAAAADAIERGDFGLYLALVRESGRSSWELLQNICPAGSALEQPMALALAAAERALEGEGAVRVHGGGFAGTIQAYVPLGMLGGFTAKMDALLSPGACRALKINPRGVRTAAE